MTAAPQEPAATPVHDVAARPARSPGVPLVVVPAPAVVTSGDGAPFAHRTLRVVVGPDVPAPVAAVVARWLGELSGSPVPVLPHDDGAPGTVLLRLENDRERLDVAPDVAHARAAGAHRVEVMSDRVVLSALAPAGLVHAAATLVQSAVPTEGTVTVPAVVVQDVPRFGWRGLSVDVARHFFDVDAVRTVLEVMAGLKLNVLHLHLTDDQGWRLEVPSRPDLTRVSARTAVGGEPGGHYSVEDFARIVEHAAALGITVVPEIDLPGHVNAALHAYGELTPSGRPTPEYTGTEVGFSRLHADLPATDAFLRDVLTDVARQTPGPFVHIGGDEVLTMEPAEYARLVALAAGHVRAAGKAVVGWQEIAKAAPEPGTVVQYWTHEQDGDTVARAVGAGALLLLSPARSVYLDMKYDATTELGLVWAGHIELRDAYEWDPLAVVPGVPESSIVGIEAAVWSETARTLDDLLLLLLPRLAAVAEVAWSGAALCSWESFSLRVGALARHWSAAGLPWYRSPQVDWPQP